jgi:hypothetical protein
MGKLKVPLGNHTDSLRGLILVILRGYSSLSKGKGSQDQNQGMRDRETIEDAESGRSWFGTGSSSQ